MDVNPTLSRRTCLRLAGCTLASAIAGKAAEPKVVVPSYNTLTDAEEIALGKKLGAQLEQELPVTRVGPLDSYINGIVSELGKRSRRPEIQYSAKVVNTADVNAVSLPGGYMYVFRGLLETASTESELVGVLAHEVGHVAARHSANQLMLNFQARQLYELVRQNLQLQNTVIEQVIMRLGGPLVALAMLRYSRELEFEADLLGCYNMLRAGWDAQGMAAMFLRLNQNHPREEDWLADLLSTHPNPTERAQRIRTELGGIRVEGDLRTNSLSFGAMKLGLKLLPAPVRPKRKAQ